MMKTMHSCCYYDNGKVEYIFAVNGNMYEDEWVPINIPSWTGIAIFCNGNDYTSAGDPTKGIPALQDTNFYAAYGS